MIFNFKRLLKTPIYYIVAFLQKNMDGYINYLKKEYIAYSGEIEDFFITKDNLKLPIYKNYRYSVKKGWGYFRDLYILSVLDHKGLLSQDEKSKFKSFITNRTINCSLEVIEKFAEIIFERNEKLFISKSPNILKPELKTIKKTIRFYEQEHKVMFHKIKAFLIELPKNKRIIEIGFVSGGYSLFGFEKLGFEVYGIDNYYDGIDSGFEILPNYIKSVENSNIRFEYGDITKKTVFGDKLIDIVYSASVLEHISDLESAFVEMSRMISDDGLLIHNYNPFYGSNGAHALGIMDTPWGHLLVDREDFLVYVKKHRPYEFESAKDWIENALNRVTISQMQQLIINAGFEILMWQEISAPKRQVDLLTQPLMKDIFSKNKNITLADLVTQNIFFVARKTKV